MKQTVTFSMFTDAFRNMGRKDQFSYNALKALYEYLEEANPDYDLDVIALCCEYVEDDYDSIRALYSRDKDESDEDTRDFLNDNTSGVWHDKDKVLYAQF